MIAFTVSVKICKYFNRSSKFNNDTLTKFYANIQNIISDVCVNVCIKNNFF